MARVHAHTGTARALPCGSVSRHTVIGSDAWRGWDPSVNDGGSPGGISASHEEIVRRVGDAGFGAAGKLLGWEDVR